MEKAVLKTLIYSNLFEYPLKAYEIHKWLIGKKANLTQVEKALNSLLKKRKIINKQSFSFAGAKDKNAYFFLPSREEIVAKRIRRQKQSLIYIRKVKIIAQILKLIPWIKLAGISGGLSMENADKADDIDLFLVTSRNRIWISRLFCLGLLSILGQRRKVNQKKVAGKICCNILVDEENLEQKRKDIYTAHEVLQMKVLWQREGIYNKYLLENEWVFKFLPNWIGGKNDNY